MDTQKTRRRVKMGKDLRFTISTDSQMVADKKGNLKLKVVTNYLDPATWLWGLKRSGV